MRLAELQIKIKIILKKYLTKRFYHYILVLVIAIVLYPIYFLYNSIKENIQSNEEYSSWIDLIFLSIEIPLLKLMIYSLIIIFVGFKIMNYAKKGFNERVYSNNSSAENNLK